MSCEASHFLYALPCFSKETLLVHFTQYARNEPQ